MRGIKKTDERVIGGQEQLIAAAFAELLWFGSRENSASSTMAQGKDTWHGQGMLELERTPWSCPTCWSQKVTGVNEVPNKQI